MLAAGIIPDDVGGDRTDDDVYWNNLRLEVIVPVAGGRILWEDRLDVGGEALPIERVTALAARGNLLVAASHSFCTDHDRFYLRAYDARSGSIVWDDATHPTDESGGALRFG